jgi:lysophospholipase L1-like esterase
MKRIGLILVCVWLSISVQCGKNRQVKESAHPVYRIVAFGDSTTAVRENIRKVYARRLREFLSQVKGNTRFEVINAGVRSDTTRRAKARFERDALAHNPQIVIIQFGLNDSCIDVFKGETGPRVDRGEYERNLVYFIRTLRQRRCKVILMTQNPLLWTDKTLKVWGKPPYDPGDPLGFNLLNKDYAESVRRIAKEQKVPLVDVYRMFLDYGAKEGRGFGGLMVDGIHPNDKGHRMILKALLPLLPKSKDL